MLYLFIFLGTLFIPQSIQAILPAEYYRESIKSSKIKAIAVVTDIKDIRATRRSTLKEVYFKTEKSFGDKIPEDFTGSCYSVDSRWQNPGVGGTIYYYPYKGERVFVAVGVDGGYITNYTRLSQESKLEEELQKNGLRNISFGYDVKIKMHYLKETHTKACDSGDMDGCLKLGLMQKDAYTRESFKEAKKLFNKACDGGLMSGCRELGTMYQDGMDSKPDRARAKELYIKACDGNDMEGCFNLGLLSYQDKEKKQAKELYHKACDGGYMSGCFQLGLMHNAGVNAKQDDAKANKLFKKVCDGGDRRGCLAFWAKKYHQACNDSDMKACLNLGSIYYRGSSVVRRDTKKAKELYAKACDGGYMEGCHELSVVYYAGGHTKQDKQKAKELFSKACDGGYMPGCFDLGRMYYWSQGEKQDKRKAKELFLKSCDGGYIGGCVYLQDELQDGCKNGNVDDCRQLIIDKKYNF